VADDAARSIKTQRSAALGRIADLQYLQSARHESSKDQWVRRVAECNAAMQLVPYAWLLDLCTKWLMFFETNMEDAL
jgi:hypothetical protein